MSATIKKENEHFPVLLNELISIISPHYGGTFIDCTFGQGGYSSSILKFNNTNVIALDRDPDCKSIAKKFKELNKERFLFFNKKFSDVSQIKKGNSTPGRSVVGKVTHSDIEKIAKEKMQDLNAIDLKGAINMVKGSAVSMGMEVVS